MRYGVSIGKDGFGWQGEGVIQWRKKWPRWNPPNKMVARQPKLTRYSIGNGGMAPGVDNPLGARALYIFQNGEDTLTACMEIPTGDRSARHNRQVAFD